MSSQPDEAAMHAGTGVKSAWICSVLVRFRSAALRHCRRRCYSQETCNSRYQLQNWLMSSTKFAEVLKLARFSPPSRWPVALALAALARTQPS